MVERITSIADYIGHDKVISSILIVSIFIFLVGWGLDGEEGCVRWRMVKGEPPFSLFFVQFGNLGVWVFILNTSIEG